MSHDEDRSLGVHIRGRTIECASTARVDAYVETANDFMFQIFDLMPGEYLISDESDIVDFVELRSRDTEDAWRRVHTHYGFDRSDVGSDRLVEIFAAIDRLRNL